MFSFNMFQKKISSTRIHILIYLIACDLVSFCIYTKSHIRFMQIHSPIWQLPSDMHKEVKSTTDSSKKSS